MYRRETCYAGKTIEVRKYHTWHCPPPGEKRTAGEKKVTKDSVERSNRRQRQTNLRRTLNAAFTKGDLYVTLTYTDKESQPEAIRDLLKDAQDFCKTLRKYNKGRETRYVYVMGAGRRTRRHIHMVINRMDDVSVLEELWTHGHVKIQILYDDDLKDLAKYMMDNANETMELAKERGEKIGRYYFSSHGLPKPTIIKENISAATFRKAVYVRSAEKKGYYLEKDTEYYGVDETGYEYYGYTLIRIDDDKDIHRHGRAEP